MSTVAEAGATVRVRAGLRAPAAGALGAQVVQALGNFVVQVFAARELGASGIGTYALLFGAVLMATALSSGLVGDSLTVLDRRETAVRSALWSLAWLVIAVSTMAAFVVGTVGISWSVGVLFATAMGSYVLADLGRRLLMARLHFWALANVDCVALVATCAVLGTAAWIGPLQLEHFLAALTVGQLTAVALIVRRLPRDERGLPPWTWGDWRAVVHYGGWRALQQFVRPCMLNGARWLVLIAAGTAVVGQLEVARIFVAPAMLLVQGFGSYLFASYAADQAEGIARLRMRADRATVAMVGGAVAVGTAAALALPLVGDLLNDGAFELSRVAVMGWACYAASCAAILPYGSLAAVRGRPLAVLVVRLVDSALSLLLVALVVVVAHADAALMPWLLSLGSFLGGVMCRQLLLSESPLPADRTTR